MKKILSLFAICAMAVTSAWADDVTEVSTQEALQTVATNGGSCKLMADIDLTATIVCDNEKTLNLDLNGHVLNGKNIPEPTSSNILGCILSTQKTATGTRGYLHITDSNPNADHSDWNTNHPTSEGYADLSNIKGAVLTGGKGFYYYGVIRGGAIYAQSGELTVKGVTIIGNTATYGGAIYVGGYTVYHTGSEGAVLDGTTIINNSATEYGAIEYVGDATKTCLTLKDCTITGNTTGSSESYTSHTALAYYTQPCVVGATADGKIILKGKNNITGNTAYGKTGNLCFVSLSDNSTTYPGSITLDASFDNESTIGISRIVGTATGETSGFPPSPIYDFAFGSGQFTTNGTAANAAAFIPDGSNFKVAYNAAGYLETVAKPVATEVTLSEDDETYPEAAVWDETKTYDITLNRTMKANQWNTLMLSFPMTAAEVKSNFGSDVTLMEMTGIENNVVSFATVDLETDDATAVDVCQPYIVKPTSAISQIKVTGKTGLESNQGSGMSMFENCTVSSMFHGYSVKSEDVKVYPAYVLSNDKFYHVDSDITVKGYRWYIQDMSGIKARALTLSLDGVTTGINEVEGLNDSNSLNGSNGKFIQDGRMVIVNNGKKFNAAGQNIK